MGRKSKVSLSQNYQKLILEDRWRPPQIKGKSLCSYVSILLKYMCVFLITKKEIKMKLGTYYDYFSIYSLPNIKWPYNPDLAH